MANNIKRIILPLLAISLCAPTMAQQLSRLEQGEILLKVWETLQDYERYSAMDKRSIGGKDNFISLFSDEKAPVFNDIIGYSDKKTLEVKEYAAFLCENSDVTRTRIYNISKEGGFFREDGIWKITCSFDKSIFWVNDCKVWYSSEFFNDSVNFHMRATLAYRDNEERCIIEKIACDDDIKYPLPETYWVLRKNNERDKEITANGERLRFNNKDQAFVPENAAFAYKDPEVLIKLIPDTASCNIWHLAYKIRRWRIRPHVDITLGDYYKMDNSAGAGWSELKNSGSEFGVDIGYSFPSRSKVKFSLNAGLLIANSSISLALPVSSYNYIDDGTGDFDGDSYIRYYENITARERIKMTHLGLPVYGDLDFHISRPFSFYLQAGVKPYLKVSTKLAERTLTAGEIYGIYPKYDNLRLDGTWGLNGFGTNVDIGMNDQTSHNLPVNGLCMDAFGGLGIRLSPLRNIPLALDLGMQYQTGIVDMWETLGHTVDADGALGHSYTWALSRYTVGSGEQSRTLCTGLSEVKRQHLKLAIGLVYKF